MQKQISSSIEPEKYMTIPDLSPAWAAQDPMPETPVQEREVTATSSYLNGTHDLVGRHGCLHGKQQ